MELTASANKAGNPAFADEAAFAAWVTNTQKQLVRFCVQITNDWADAEDAAQEAYWRAWQKRKSFRGDCDLLTWVMAIAKRVCLDSLRGKRVVTLPLTLTDHEAAPLVDHETAMDVQATLQRLPAADRALLYVHVHLDLPFESAARVWGISPAACRKRFERAKKRFEALYTQSRKDEKHE